MRFKKQVETEEHVYVNYRTIAKNAETIGAPLRQPETVGTPLR